MRPRQLKILQRTAFAAGTALIGIAVQPALSKPLEQEACAQLKSQRDTLAATGLGDVVRQRPTERRADMTPERAKQVRTLINLDGQLRFRCGIDLLLPTLKPDPVEEFVDAGDTATSARPAPRPPAKKPKAAKAAPAEPAATTGPAASPTNGTGTQVAPSPKTAAAKPVPAAEATVDPTPKAAPKSRTKPDDAFRAGPGGDPNASSLDKQLPKSQ
jgi:hypothetical protein